MSILARSLLPKVELLDKTYFKILIFMKRRHGLDVETFRNYYEQHHVPLCQKYSSGISRYVRRYLTPHTHGVTGERTEFEYDVITELWFDNEKVFKGTLNYLSTETMSDEIVADEERFLDRTSFRLVTEVECVNEN